MKTFNLITLVTALLLGCSQSVSAQDTQPSYNEKESIILISTDPEVYWV